MDPWGALWRPDWSPDGTRIAFYVGFSSNRIRGIRTLSLTDGGQRTLTNDWDYVADPQWSPDGRFIAYHSSQGIWLIPAKGGTPARVTTCGNSPAWSPDGRLLAFLARGGHSEIWSIDVDSVLVSISDAPS